jgi:hypothetical protein
MLLIILNTCIILLLFFVSFSQNHVFAGLPKLTHSQRDNESNRKHITDVHFGRSGNLLVNYSSHDLVLFAPGICCCFAFFWKLEMIDMFVFCIVFTDDPNMTDKVCSRALQRFKVHSSLLLL